MSSRPKQPSIAGVTAASNFLLLGVLAGAAWLALADIERQTRQNVCEALDTVLETANGALVVWARDRKGNADELARNPAVRAAAAELLRGPREPGRLRTSPRLNELRAVLAHEALHHEHDGFLVVAPDGVVVASMHDSDLGTRSVLLGRPQVFARALRGEPVLVPPVRSRIALPGPDGRARPGTPTMFVAAPIRSDRGAVGAVLALRLDPHRDFSRLAELGRVGVSGETYAFDRDGRVLTTLRYTPRTAATPHDGGSPILAVRLADPGPDGPAHTASGTSPDTRPLTHAVAGAIEHGRGHDLRGYRDYRGVRVLGAWTWNPELGLGLVSELDEAAALRGYLSTRRSIVVLVGVTALLSSVLVWLLYWVQGRGSRALAERETRTQSILDTALDGIVTIDSHGRIETSNAAADAMFGYEAGAMVDRELSTLVRSAGAETPEELIARHLDAGPGRAGRVDREVEGVRRDGTTFPLELGLARVPTRGERRYTAVLRDIEERKSLEARFLQSQKLQAVGQLAAGVAHDFNNLLMGVDGLARVGLHRLEDPARMRRLLGEIRGATATGAAITRQLLAMTRVKTGRPIAVELDAVVQQSRAVLERLIGEDIHLEVELAAPGAWLRCGEGHLEQLLMNLVVNARDAMPSGGALQIRTGEHEVDGAAAGTALTPGRYLLLEVRDSGVGMDEDVRSRISEPFFTTKAAGEGTGLGLSTVYGIVSQSGGRIEVDSRPGEGTTFRVLLPRVEAPAREPARVASVAPLPPMTVLVVEDDPLVRDALCHDLRTAGHRALGAAGRREAHAICAAHVGPIDALVTDVVLRNDSGPEVADDVRARDPSVAIVYVSAHPAEYLWKTGRLEPGVGALQKPFEPEELAAALRAATEGARSQVTRERAPDEPTAVLLVEDQDAARSATAELLEEEGFRVLAARDGAEAERLYDAERGQVLVVTDFGLPDVSGDVLVERLAARHPLRGVVYVSGRDAQDPEVSKALSRPHTAFLAKPVDIDVLVERLRHVS